VPLFSTNRIVRSVTAANRKPFLADCETVDLRFSAEIAEGGRPLSHVYFPLSGCISQIAGTAENTAIEVGLVGDEGMVGATVMLGVDAAPTHAVVQGQGSSLRMQGHLFASHAAANPRLERLVMRYIFVQMQQLAQGNVCTRYHKVDERLARWLLMMHDRMHADRFAMTHEFLAAMLGVRRSGVTEAANSLFDRNLIGYHRGEITIIDRAGLEKAACPCYGNDTRAYHHLMH
jgi:CRP-like cAMP-binding protein